jgi:hypothetical protein
LGMMEISLDRIIRTGIVRLRRLSVAREIWLRLAGIGDRNATRVQLIVGVDRSGTLPHVHAYARGRGHISFPK